LHRLVCLEHAATTPISYPFQIGEIAQRAVTAYEEQEGKEQLQVENEPFTFKVPVTLAGLQLYAEYMVSVTSCWEVIP